MRHKLSGLAALAVVGAALSFNATAIGLAELGVYEVENGPANKQDLQFIRAVADAELVDVELSKIAVTRAQSPDVRAFAKRMQREHQALVDKSFRIGRDKGLGEFSVTLPSEGYGKVQRLRATSVADFDREYMNTQVASQKISVAAMRKELAEGSDVDVKNFARYSLLDIDQNVQMANALMQSAGM